MRHLVFLILPLLAACKGPGYRNPGDSEELRLDIEDKNIASRVRIALGQDPETAPYGSIRVHCVEGKIELVGAVDRAAVKRRAEEVALACAGVRRVRNKINVPAATDQR